MQRRTPPALAVVIMGVSGCGKSAVAAGVGRMLGLRAIDGDDLHAPESVAKMRAGTPLTDDDRWPWLDRVGAALADTGASPAGTVIACSALRRAYRDRLRAACPGLQLVFLDGDAEIIAGRVGERRDHYMPPALLASQLKTLERPGSDEPDVTRLDIAQPLSDVVAQACAALTRRAF
ncbi:MAG: gluconokinase [Comamonadaceae bacterium]|nr:MAG: gluconokinase [Comamonadaceae bacterium]